MTEKCCLNCKWVGKLQTPFPYCCNPILAKRSQVFGVTYEYCRDAIKQCELNEWEARPSLWQIIKGWFA